MTLESKNVKKLSNQSLIAELKHLVTTERKITAEIIECLKEIDGRRLYLEHGYTSMFAFLTKEFAYTPAAAQRRIDAARLSQVIPDLKENLKSGVINLSQVSMVAQAVRQKQKEDPDIKISDQHKQELFQQVQSMDLIETEKTLAKNLDLQIKKHESKTFQQDGSVRIELTLSAEQFRDSERVKELISHQQLNPSMSDLFNFIVNDYLKRKDPLRRDVPSAPVARACQKGNENKEAKVTEKAPEPNRSPNITPNTKSKTNSKTNSKRTTISENLKAQVFQRDRCCQWKDPNTKQQCDSKFQLQIDHRQPLWQGGDNELENLQLLCAVHNRLKYEKEIGARSVSF